MGSRVKVRKKRKKWGVHNLLITPADKGHMIWEYDSEYPSGGYLSVHSDESWAYVSSDDYQGTAMFPKVLIPELIRELRKVARAERPSAKGEG